MYRWNTNDFYPKVVIQNVGKEKGEISISSFSIDVHQWFNHPQSVN